MNGWEEFKARLYRNSFTGARDMVDYELSIKDQKQKSGELINGVPKPTHLLAGTIAQLVVANPSCISRNQHSGFGTVKTYDWNYNNLHLQVQFRLSTERYSSAVIYVDDKEKVTFTDDETQIIGRAFSKALDIKTRNEEAKREADRQYSACNVIEHLLVGNETQDVKALRDDRDTSGFEPIATSSSPDTIKMVIV